MRCCWIKLPSSHDHGSSGFNFRGQHLQTSPHNGGCLNVSASYIGTWNTLWALRS